MTKTKTPITPEEQSELAIEMFGVLIEQQEAQAGSRNPNYSPREKNRLDKKAEDLGKRFGVLAKKAEGDIIPRHKPKGEAYSLAEYYLSRHPMGALSVNRGSSPSMLTFARRLQSECLEDPCVVETNSGKLEIENVTNNTIAMALSGKAVKEFTLAQLKIGFQRAKSDTQKNRIIKGSDPLI